MATFQEIQEAKLKHSTTSYDELNNLPQRKLYAVARSLDVRTFETPQGVVYSSKVKKANKPYLVDTVWGILEEFRAANRNQVKSTIQHGEHGTYDFKNLVATIYADFYQLCSNYVSGQAIEVERVQENKLIPNTPEVNLILAVSALGSRLANRIQNTLHYRTSEHRSDLTHLTDVRDAFKIFEQEIAKDKFLGDILSEMLPYFKKGVKQSFTEAYSHKKQVAAKREQEILETEDTQVSVANYLVWAKKILEEIPAKPKRGYWKNVSIALAIATGRRMNEIHFAATKFEVINQDWVWFTGQSKGRDYSKMFFDKYPRFAIPTLVPAQLVVKGFEYLKQDNKIVEDDRLKVNKKWSSDLCQHFKKVKKEVGIPAEITFHENRDLYAQCALQCPAIPEVFETIPNANKRDADYACYLLGEGRVVYEVNEVKRYQLQKNLAFLRYQDKYLVTDEFKFSA